LDHRVNVYDEKSRSAWMDIDPPSFPSLSDNLVADVVVIGSGIAGLSTAYELSAKGASVVVLDRGSIARGMTARTSAHLTSALDDLYQEYISIRGIEIAKLHFASQAAAIRRISEISEREAIDCDYALLTAYLFLAGKEKPKTLTSERRALTDVGLSGSKVEKSPKIKHKLSDGPCLVIPEQGRFHPIKYLDGLASACVRQGVRLFADSCVTKVEESKSNVLIKTRNDYSVRGDAVVVATNTPINDRVTIHTKQAPYRTYVLTADVPEGAIKDALYWDTEDPYHYVRLHPFANGPLLLVGGEDHKSGTTDDADARFVKLEQWARERFPEMRKLRHRWSGQVMDTIDYAAFIGLNPGNERIFISTGDSGQGITHGVVAGLMLPDLIQQGEHMWTDVYAPARKPMRSAGKYFSEGFDVLKNLTEHVLPGEISSPEDLPPGGGGIHRQGAQLLAVCRDQRGKVHTHSASCTHAGCIVHWNSFEQCWDCPCHGSQFAPDGTALNGPAIGSLSTANDVDRK
jgi:glycine/D-amino acid oxidase-like deaminating enzyme/nitrite reductase/ring-hydroxylating ferredoxin subunit